MKNIQNDNNDKVDGIQKNIDETVHKMEVAQELIAQTPDKRLKNRLAEKNQLRKRALDEWKHAETHDKNAVNEKEYKE